MSRVFFLTIKFLKETIREPAAVAFVVLVPLFFVFICAIATSHEPRPVTRTLLFSTPVTDEQRTLSERLRRSERADGTRVFNVVKTAGPVDRAGTDAMLRERKADASLGFEADGSWIIRGDATWTGFIAASSLVEDAVRGMTPGMDPIEMDVRDARIRIPRSEYDAAVPGQLIFVSLLLIPLAAFLAAREIRTQTMSRLSASPLRPWEYVAGLTASQMIFVIPASLACLAFAMLLGFRPEGSLWLAVLIQCGVSLSSIGLGLAIAPFCSSDSAALNGGGTLTMLLVFFSGSFFELSTPALFTLRGREIRLFDFLPATQGQNALTHVLTGGAGFSDVSFRLAALAVLSLVIFTGSVAVFRARTLRR